MKLRRVIVRILVVLIVIMLIVTSGGAFLFLSYIPHTLAPQSFPQIDGQINVPGLTASVDVYRDQMGIPNLYAINAHDLFFAQGYVHAQDRFWQMDTWRHIGAGRLSEMFGSAQVDTDSFLRTLGWEQTAQAEWDQLDPDSRAILQAYSDGVNAYLKDHNGTTLSLEYAVLKLLSPKYTIEPWTPVNSLTWGKAMAWDLRGNMDEEIQRAVLLKTLTPEQVSELYPPYPSDHPVIVNHIGTGSASLPSPAAVTGSIPDQALVNLEQNVSLLDQLLGPLGDGIGSNSWVVSGSLTTTGEPILANDPHLAIQMPSIWYQVGMHCQPKTDQCPFEMAGFSFAGVPGVVIGHNDRISWGFTNTSPDVMDLYIEKVNPDNPNQYEVNGQWVDFQTRTETIKVSGGAPVTLTVRSTRHGPVISQTYGPLMDQGSPNDPKFVPFKDSVGIPLPDQYVIALKWTALTPSTPFKAVWGFDKAQNWEEFRNAASQFHVPAQNLVYADVDGNIGYQMPGDVPIRANGDGRLPVPGWTDDYEWTGFIPFDQLPYTFNPSEGYIVTANNQVVSSDYPYFITSDWDYGFRANRIVDMITSAPAKIDLAYIQKMQGDTLDPNAAVFVPVLAQMDSSSLTSDESMAMGLLSAWDGQARVDSAPAAVFEVFWRHLLQDTFDNKLPETYWPDGGSRWDQVMRQLPASSSWWDDPSTTNMVETRAEILKKAFTEAVQELVKDFGNDSARWSWGGLHTATFRNQTLGESGISLIEGLFNRGPFATGGGASIVDATGWSINDGYEVISLPSMRMIVDLGNLAGSLTVHTTGQSGHAYNQHYADMAPLWAGIQYYPMLWDQATITHNAEGHLILMP